MCEKKRKEHWDVKKKISGIIGSIMIHSGLLNQDDTLLDSEKRFYLIQNHRLIFYYCYIVYSNSCLTILFYFIF